MTLLLALGGWVVLVVLTVGPIFSAQRREEDSGWTWIIAALLLGPLAGIGYYMSRHAMRKVSGRHTYVLSVADDQSWVPEHNQDQSCAFCGVSRPVFVHRLDPAHVVFRVYGKGCTLPTFWAACARCESLVAAADDEALLRLMAHEEEDELARAGALAAFRASDLGGEPLREGPPDRVRP